MLLLSANSFSYALFSGEFVYMRSNRDISWRPGIIPGWVILICRNIPGSPRTNKYPPAAYGDSIDGWTYSDTTDDTDGHGQRRRNRLSVLNSATPNCVRLDNPPRRSQASNSLRSETPMRVSLERNSPRPMQPPRAGDRVDTVVKGQDLTLGAFGNSLTLSPIAC
jgi:hypothetical protein